MVNEGVAIVKRGQVEQVVDLTDGLRIKVRLDIDDENKKISDIPYAFPLLPKCFQVIPKVGEGALVLTCMSNNNESQRYYIGPIISQPQFNYWCSYDKGRGDAASLIGGGALEPLEGISNYKKSTDGSFPKTNDVAVIGRGTQDIILRDNNTNQIGTASDVYSNEIDIRCGIRNSQSVSDKGGLIGSVVFNNIDPAYIQLKYKKNLTNEYEQDSNSMINIVADKINIISHKDKNYFNLTDNKELIKEEELDDIMSKLHRVPWGDKLVELLYKIIRAICEHVHPYAGMPAEAANVSSISMKTVDGLTDELLSKDVRTS